MASCRLLRWTNGTRILRRWAGGQLAWADELAMVYRVVAIMCAGFALAACEGNADWMKADWKSPFRFEPPLQTVQFESEPAGAEAKVSNGQSCRTPCALALPGDKALDVTFTLNGYQADSEKLDLVAMGDGTSELRPNPVLVELSPVPPPAKPARKPVHRKKVAAKPTPKAAAQPTAATAPPPMAQQPAQAPSPWPTSPPPGR
ncbi:MAG TPA: hypothetical protein VFA57_09900 [Pseudolabrys sp.]|nr:hypothetical protein [Pseudolabrys sp.]